MKEKKVSKEIIRTDFWKKKTLSAFYEKHKNPQQHLFTT
jgi:hypothetical protein